MRTAISKMINVCHKKCIIEKESKFEDYKKCLENSKTIVRSQQRFRSELQHVFREKVNKIAPIVQMMARGYRCLIESSHAYGTGSKTVCISCPWYRSWNSVQSRIDETSRNKKFNIMINFDEVTEENMQTHNSCWPKIPDHPYSNR